MVPDLRENLISVTKLQADGLKVEFDNNVVVHCKRDGKVLLAYAEEDNGLYCLDIAWEKIHYVSEKLTFTIRH